MDWYNVLGVLNLATAVYCTRKKGCLIGLIASFLGPLAFAAVAIDDLRKNRSEKP